MNYRGLGILLMGMSVVMFMAARGYAQVIPTVTGRTFTLPTSANHKLFIPDGFDLSAQGVDVLVHFHGNPATVNNNAGYAGLNTVIVNVTYSGFSSAYSTPFSDPTLFGNVLDSALSTLRGQPDFPANTQWDQLGISSFSAGYGAVREILKQPTYYDQIDGLLLADSLYAGFTSSSDHTPVAYQMVDFKRFALDAANAQKTMIVSHSQVQTYTYANTAETADNLMQHVGVTPVSTTESGLGTLQFYRKAQLGDFSVWGATGADAPAHSRHLQYMGQWLGDLPFDDVVLPPPITGDINADGFVGITDLNILLGNWNQSVPMGSISDGDISGIGDGYVGIDDLNVILGNWNAGTPPTSAAVPEPASATLFTLTAMCLLRRVGG
jgi:hypothetical protein